MSLSDDEIQGVLRAKREIEARLEETRHLIEPGTLRMLREERERMRELIDPPGLRAFIDEQQWATNLVGDAMLKHSDERTAINLAVNSSFIRPLLDAESSAKRILQDIAESLTAANVAISHSVFSTGFLDGMRRFAAEHEATSMKTAAVFAQIAERLKPIALNADFDRLSNLLRPIDLTTFYEDFKHVEEISRAAQSVMATVRLDALGDLIGVIDPAGLQLDAYRLNRSYATYAASIATMPDSAIEAPFMAKVPTLSVYTHARVMRSITTHGGKEPVVEVWSDVRKGTTVTIETVLPRVSPMLLRSWNGGWATARRKDEDWVRQAAASLRYVLITTLDTIAPKDKVLADGVDRRHLTPKGEPTRLGQVAWLCRSIKNKTYRKMVFSDLESALNIIDTMSEAVHREEYPEIEEAFGRMAIRAAVALQHLLEIFNTRN